MTDGWARTRRREPAATPRSAPPRVCAASVLALSLAACLAPGETPYGPVETGAPELLATVPEDGAIEVPAGVVLELHFSEPLDPASFTTRDLDVRTGLVFAPGRLDYAEGARGLYRYLPAEPLVEDVLYQVHVSGEVTDQRYNPMGETVSFGFQTARAPAPFAVSFLDPSSGAVDVPVTVQPLVRFTADVPEVRLTGAHFELRTDDGVRASARVEHADGDRRAVRLTPGRSLQPQTTYRIRVAAEVVNVSGQPLGLDVESAFTTAP